MHGWSGDGRGQDIWSVCALRSSGSGSGTGSNLCVMYTYINRLNSNQKIVKAKQAEIKIISNISNSRKKYNSLKWMFCEMKNTQKIISVGAVKQKL